MKHQTLTAILAIFLLTAGAAMAAGGVSISSGSVHFSAGGDGVLTVTGPDGFEHRQQIDAAGASLSLFDAGGGILADGAYSWQITLDGKAPDERSGKPVKGQMTSGTFTIAGGSVADPNALEGGFNKDNVILDDLIVDGSACIGLDCANGESFGFDTLRLKENNLRIKFQDSSSGSGSFPSNDWQITANDSANGGANKFSIDDIDGGKTPFTVEAGAPSHSLYVDDAGNLGLNTSTPVVEVHIADGDSPTLRLEQNGSSGFTPQTWDIAGNETNFFVRDVTGGSKLPFKIKPGAPDNSLFVKGDGNIGLGTDNPASQLHVLEGGSAFSAFAGTGMLVQSNASTADGVIASLLAGSAGSAQLSFGDSDNQFVGRILYNNTDNSMRFDAAGSAQITISDDATNTITHQHSTAVLTRAGQWQSASSRALKKNINGLSTEAALAALSGLEPVTYNYKTEPDELVAGFIAEDVPELVATASHKTLSSLDLIAVLTKVVQDQQQTITGLEGRLSELEAQP